MQRPFPAYKGDAPFVFVSYAHTDVAAVYPELSWLKEQGFNVWYDEGIDAGSEWREEIARAIKTASAFLYFVTADSAGSENCRKEVNFAIDQQVPLIAIHLESTALPDGLSLTLSDRQAILRHEVSEDEYRDKLLAGLAKHLPSPETPAPAVDRGDDLAAMFSIAVLPFSSRGNDEESQMFAEGLSEEIVDNLALGEYYRLYFRWPLKVASRNSSFQFADRTEDLSVIARRLNVSYVLEGNVRRRGEELRITAQLIRAADGFHVWSKPYAEALANDFEAQTRIAQNVSHLASDSLWFDFWKQHWAELDEYRGQGYSPVAMEHFIDAEYQYRLIRLGEGGDWTLYEQLLKRSVDSDPGFIIGHAILAFCYMKRLGGRLALADAAPAAHSAIDKALALDPAHRLTLWQLGEIYLNLDLDYAKAEAIFKGLLERSPGLIWMHYNLAQIAVREGRIRDGLTLLATASALDAGYEQAGFLNSYAWLLQVVGDFEHSLSLSAEGLNLALGGPERATNLKNQAAALISLDRNEEAKPLIAESWALDGSVNPERYVYLFAKTGDEDRARGVLNDPRHQFVDHYSVALGYLALGEIDDAFSSIEVAIADHDVLLVDSLRTANWWDEIRTDSRFAGLLEALDALETHTEQYLTEREPPAR